MRLSGSGRGIYSRCTSLYLASFRFWHPDVCVSGVESKLPNREMLPAKYTSPSMAYGVFTDAQRHVPFCLNV